MFLWRTLLVWLLVAVISASGQKINFQVYWEPRGSVMQPLPRVDSTLVVNEHQLVLFGGRNQTVGSDPIPGQQITPAPILSHFDLVAKMWHVPQQHTEGPGSRYGHVAHALTGLNAMVVYGGFGVSGVLSDLWVYDIVNTAWTKPVVKNTVNQSLPHARGYHTLTALPDSDPDSSALVMFGGSSSPSPQSNASVFDDLWGLKINCTIKTTVNGTKQLSCTALWTKLTIASASTSVGPTARYGHAAAYFVLRNQVGWVLSFMGLDANGRTTSDVVAFNPDIKGASYTFRNSGVSESDVGPRCFHSVVTDGTSLYLYGGYGTNTETAPAVNIVQVFILKSDGIILKAQQPTQNATNPVAHHASAMLDLRNFRPNVNDSCNDAYSEQCCTPISQSVTGNKEELVMMTFGGQENSTYISNDLWGFRQSQWIDPVTSVQDYIWFRFSAARSSAQMFQNEESDGTTDGYRITGGVTNLYGTFPGQHIVGAQVDINLAAEMMGAQSALVMSPGVFRKPTCEQVASLHDHSMIEWTHPGTNVTKIFVHGGRKAPNAVGNAMEPDRGISNITYVLTKGDDTWTVLQPLKGSPTLIPRYAHCACVYDKYMLVFGGVPHLEDPKKLSGPDTLLWMLDLESGLWNATNSSSTMISGIFGHSCSVIKDKMIVVGGVQGDDFNQPPSDMSKWQFDASVFQYDIHSLTWTTLESSGGVSLTKGIAFHKIMHGPNQTLIAIGGITNADDTTGWTVITDMPVVAAGFSQSIIDSEQPYNGWYQVFKNTSSLLFPGLCQFSLAGENAMLSTPLCRPILKCAVQGTKDLHALVYGGILPDGEVSTDIWEASFTFKEPTPTPVPSPTPTPGPHQPTTMPTMPTDDNSGPSSVTVILIIVASLAIVAVIVGVGVGIGIYYRRNARRIKEFQDSLAVVQHHAYGDDENKQENWGEGNKQHPEDYRTVPQKFGEALVNKPSWVIDFEELRIIKQIGHGSTCVVHVGWWGNNPVAVKRFFLHAKHKADDFYRETLVHRQLKHRNVLELLAITINPPCSVTPLMRYGSLFHLIQSGQKLSYSHILQIAIDTVDGMRYLHSQNVIHRDLKTLNLLVDDSWCVKVCDFGIARFQLSAMTAAVGSIQYMAPEVFMQNHCTIKSDVYSFAIVLWEMFTREVPYKENPSPFAVCVNVREGRRLKIPADCPPEYATLIEKCWNQDANERPDFEEVFIVLQDILEDAERQDLIKTPKGGSLRDSMKDLAPIAGSADIEEQFQLLPSSTASGSPGEMGMDTLSTTGAPLN